MTVGSTPITVYQGEDVVWPIAIDDIRIVDIAGYDIELVIKETADEPDPALIGPVTCSITGALSMTASLNVDLAPGVYVYSVRRVDPGFSWQLAQGALTVLDSASIDTAP